MTDHARIEELIVARALGGIDPEDDRELDRLRAEHGSACAECAQLDADYTEVAGRLAFTLEPVSIPEGMEERLMERALGVETASRPKSSESVISLSDRRDRRASAGAAEQAHRGTWIRRVGVGIAAAVLVIAAAAGGYLAAPGGSDKDELVALMTQPGSRVVQFAGAGDGSLALAYVPGEEGAYVFGDVEAPPRDKVYELWMMFDDGRAPRAVTTFSEGGSLVVEIEADPSGADAMGVTIEEEMVQAPTSDQIWTAPLSA